MLLLLFLLHQSAIAQPDGESASSAIGSVTAIGSGALVSGGSGVYRVAADRFARAYPVGVSVKVRPGRAVLARGSAIAANFGVAASTACNGARARGVQGITDEEILSLLLAA